VNPSGFLIVGDLVTDTVVQLHQRQLLGTDSAASIIDLPGGQGGNVASWLTFLGCTDVQLIAAVSARDLFDHQGLLERGGVQTRFEVVEAPPARIICSISPDRLERSFLTQRGANELLSPASLERVDWSRIRWCHISGYLLTTGLGRETYAHLRRRCDEHNIAVSLDPASSSVIEQLGDRWAEIVGRVAVLKCNLQEATALTGESLPERAATLLFRTAKTVVITLGPEGAVAVSSTGEVIRAAASSTTTVLDPTGAGDAFAAGLLISLQRGEELSLAVACATQSGAQAVTRLGARP
jgi:sugar/nucleoside kinase (ribokinase family)